MYFQRRAYPIKVDIDVFFYKLCKNQAVIAKSFLPSNTCKLSVTDAASTNSIWATKALKF